MHRFVDTEEVTSSNLVPPTILQHGAATVPYTSIWQPFDKTEGLLEFAMPKKRSWREKLADSKGLPRVVSIPENMSRWGSGTLVIPAPSEVDELMKRVPAGSVTTINEIRAALARKHGTDICCPMTAGIFATIAARAANEAEAEGETDMTPYWRTLKTGGELNPNYPGGVESLKLRLEAEGHSVVSRGKKLVVLDYERSLGQL